MLLHSEKSALVPNGKVGHFVLLLVIAWRISRNVSPGLSSDNALPTTDKQNQALLGYVTQI